MNDVEAFRIFFGKVQQLEVKDLELLFLYPGDDLSRNLLFNGIGFYDGQGLFYHGGSFLLPILFLGYDFYEVLI
jgi:hypothetical protein